MTKCIYLFVDLLPLVNKSPSPTLRVISIKLTVSFFCSRIYQFEKLNQHVQQLYHFIFKNIHHQNLLEYVVLISNNQLSLYEIVVQLLKKIFLPQKHFIFVLNLNKRLIHHVKIHVFIHNYMNVHRYQIPVNVVHMIWV